MGFFLKPNGVYGLTSEILTETPVLIIDCQTTGMRPSVGSLLEISWCLYDPAAAPASLVEAYLVQLPEGHEIPWRVQEITGITAHHLTEAVGKDVVAAKLRGTAARLGSRARVIIHYAQFEKPWLEDLLGSDLQMDFVCTFQITKKLFPHLPCRNIRGVSGFFGKPVGQVKRAGEHVQATTAIWAGLTEELRKQGVEDWPSLANFTEEKPKPGKRLPKKYEYRIDKEKRLKLPTAPGVYRMLAKSGDILYVGKATSLRDRVNSYFRGIKGRDPRKLEMLAQVWDLNYTECKSALEAALLETDEIKRHDPPYNVSLKRGKRKLVFYSRSFDRAHLTQDAGHPIGAFRMMNPIEDLRPLLLSIQKGVVLQVFRDTVEEGLIVEGFELFQKKHALDLSKVTGMRSLLAIALRMYRTELRKKQSVEVSEPSEDALDDASTDELTDEANVEPSLAMLSPFEVSEKFDRMFLRAGREIWRARHLTRLLYSEVAWEAESGPRRLLVAGGQFVETQPERELRPYPWQNLDIGDYDRMSVLYSGVSIVPHSIRSLGARN